jgi:hypothetical protein
MQLHADVIVYNVDRSADPFRAGRWANISLHDKRGLIPTMEAQLHLKLAPDGDPTDDIKDAVQMLVQLIAGGSLVDIVDGRNAFATSSDVVDIPLLGDNPFVEVVRPDRRAPTGPVVPTLPTRVVPPRRGGE